MVNFIQLLKVHSADHPRAISRQLASNFMVDLDAEKGQTPRQGRENKHRVGIKLSKKVQFASVRVYLDDKMDFDNEILKRINFLDHLLRETLSKSLINLRRSYFARHAVSEKRTPLRFSLSFFIH